MGPKTKIYTLGNRALKLPSFDLSHKNMQFLKCVLIFAKNLAKMGSKFIGGLNQKSGSIFISGKAAKKIMEKYYL